MQISIFRFLIPRTMGQVDLNFEMQFSQAKILLLSLDYITQNTNKIFKVNVAHILDVHHGK